MLLISYFQWLIFARRVKVNRNGRLIFKHLRLRFLTIDGWYRNLQDNQDRVLEESFNRFVSGEDVVFFTPLTWLNDFKTVDLPEGRPERKERSR